MKPYLAIAVIQTKTVNWKFFYSDFLIHLKPLLRNVSQTKRFHLLTLSQKTIKFFEASEDGITELFLKGMPRNISSFLKSNDVKFRVSFLLFTFTHCDKFLQGYTIYQRVSF